MPSKLLQYDAGFLLPVAPTASDIEQGKTCSTDSCPLARQFKRDIAHRFRRWENIKIRVGTNFATINAKVGKKTAIFTTKIDPDTREFISDFDNDLTVFPGDTGRVLEFEFDGYKD